MNPISPIFKLLRGLISLFNKIFYGMTHPIKGLEMIIRTIRQRAFSLVLFLGSAILVFYATIDYLPQLLEEVAGFSKESAYSKSVLLALFTESLLGLSEIKRWKKSKWLLLFTVLLLNMSGFLLEYAKHYETLNEMQRVFQIIIAFSLNGLPIIGMSLLGKDISKIPMKRRKRKGTRLTQEERELLKQQILEHTRARFQENDTDSLSFKNIASVFSDRKIKPDTVSRIIKESDFDLWKNVKAV